MPPRAKKQKTEAARPPPSPGSSQQSSAHPYDPITLGGRTEEVGEILDENPEWNADVIEELLKWGAKPPLHVAGNGIPGQRFVSVNCTFVAPDGSLIPNVILPAGLVKLEYPEQSMHIHI